MKGPKRYASLLLVLIVTFLHLSWAPFTKVEESFNMQAIHDIVFYGIPMSNVKERLATHFDHVAFPGAVPRTFVGAVFVAQISKLWTGWAKGPEDVQVIVRGLLGLCNALALINFQDAVGEAFGTTAAVWYVLLQVSQFHVMYYISRTLPNMFAFGLSTTAVRYLILSNYGPREKRAKRSRLALYLLTLAGVIFRSELAILLMAQCAWLVFARKVSLRHVIIPAGITAATIGLLITISVDSFFWQRFPLWPEWVGFRYNTLEGRSADWGTSPWHFYFFNAIPRLMMNPMSLFVCIPLALTTPSTRPTSTDILAPLLAFVTIYSFLPHKEWRFILYVVPGLTAVAAAGASWIWTRRSKSLLYRLLALSLVASTLASLATSIALLAISSLNYPGAAALLRLHTLADSERPLLRVHLGNLACQTGVTRFLQKRIDPAAASAAARAGGPVQTVWYYDKTESAEQLGSAAFWERFDYVVTEDVGSVLGNWDVVEAVDGYAGIALSTEAPSLGATVALVQSRGLRGDGSGDTGLTGLVVGRAMEAWAPWEKWLRAHVTGCRWVSVRMEPQLWILKKTD